MSNAPKEHAGERNRNGTFAPGKSGNPNGRPKRSRNFVTIFNDKRDELVRLKTPGGEVEMSRMEAWITNAWNNAIKGDAKANNNILAIMRATGQLQPAEIEEEELDPNAKAVLDGLIERRMRDKTDNGDDQ